MIEYTKEEQKQHSIEWMPELRSGKYTQCQFVFRNDGGDHCIIGVGVDTSNAFGFWNNKGAMLSFDDVEHFSDEDSKSRFLVSHFLDYYGLTEEIFKELMLMNDRGDSLDDLANKIESIL